MEKVIIVYGCHIINYDDFLIIYFEQTRFNTSQERALKHH